MNLKEIYFYVYLEKELFNKEEKEEENLYEIIIILW